MGGPWALVLGARVELSWPDTGAGVLDRREGGTRVTGQMAGGREGSGRPSGPFPRSVYRCAPDAATGSSRELTSV